MSAMSPKVRNQNANLRLHPENLKPHPENLRRGGKKPRPLTTQEIEFCLLFAASGNAIESAIKARLSRPRNCYSLLARPLVQEKVAQFRLDFQQKALEAAIHSFEINASLVDQAMVEMIVNGKHEMARVKGAEVVYKRLKLIIPGSNNTDQNNVPQVDIYKPLWLRQTETLMLQESRNRILGSSAIDAPLQREPLTIEEAKQYLHRAKGDKEMARRLAIADGRKF
jgi:hypothetical protein